jgi:hypothetical protein
MPTKFYFHDATTTNTGTLPGAAASVSASAPSRIATNGGINRVMNDTIGVAQVTATLATLANTSSQTALIRRFMSAPIAAQTIASQNIIVRFAASQSSTNSTFWSGPVVVAVWRPGTGAVVGRFWDTTLAVETTTATTQTAYTHTRLAANVTGVTAQDGDILVVELWRSTQLQTMSTSYNNFIYYDGTTEGSNTSNAAHIEFVNDVTMLAVAGVDFPFTGGGYYG